MDYDAFARDFVATHKYDPDQPRDRRGRWTDTDDWVDPFDAPSVPKADPSPDGTDRGDVRVAAHQGGWNVQPYFVSEGRQREVYKNYATMATIDVEFDDKTGALLSAKWGATRATGRHESTTTDPKVVAEWLRTRNTPFDAATADGRRRRRNSERAADLMERTKLRDEVASQLDKELAGSSLSRLEVSDISPFSDADGTFGFSGGLHDADFVPEDNSEGRPDAAQFIARVLPDGTGQVDTLWDSNQERLDPDADAELYRALRRVLLTLGAEHGVNRADLII